MFVIMKGKTEHYSLLSSRARVFIMMYSFEFNGSGCYWK